jgi:hypothetical protein
MKSLRRLLSAALLTFVLAATAFADDGIIHSDRSPTPTPTPGINSLTDAPPALGTTSGDSGNVSNTTTDAVIEVALRVLGEMFAIY